MALFRRACVITTLVLVLPLVCASHCRAASTTRVSVTSDGIEGNGHSGTASVSADGRYVAFDSEAPLTAGDTNGARDIFVHDRETGETERVSVTTSGAEANDGSFASVISADGRYVAFTSSADNLVAGDGNDASDVFVHDRWTGETYRASVATTGVGGDAASVYPAISTDGRYVAFISAATNLVAGDTNGVEDVFVRDLQAGETERVSVTSTGAQVTGMIWCNSSAVAISGDGRYVAFSTDAASLVLSDTNGVHDIFVHDRETGQTDRVSVAGDGSQANGMSCRPSISADGRYIAFISWASNLVPGDTNGVREVFVYDRETGQVERVALASDGSQAAADSTCFAISADGQHVAFVSGASNLVTGDENGRTDVFVRDRLTGQTERASVADDGTEASSNSYRPVITADGRYIAFSSGASLVADDLNGYEDVFVRDRGGAGFGADATAGIAPLVVSFTDLSTGSPVAWLWAFGDGETGSDQDPVHTYAAAGDYTVSLTVECYYGPDTLTRPDYISVLPSDAPPVAGFSASPRTGQAPLAVSFTDTSTNGPTLWLWSFGDGESSTSQHPQHTYQSPGSYTVSLAVVNAGGADTKTEPGYVVVSAATVTPSADFSASPRDGTAPLSVSFVDASTSGPTSWAWDFGDGAIADTQNPGHTYVDAGTYTVGLTVTNSAGSDTETKADYITVVSPPVADFSGTPTIGITPLAVSFTDLSTGDPTAWAWDFGDGHTSMDRNPTHIYTDPGYYTVTLTASKGVVADMDEQVGCIAVGFIDTPADHWAFHSILACATAGVVQGYSDYSYKPSDPVTRAQMAAYIARALASGDGNVPDPAVAAPSFTDVGTDHWAYRYVEYVREQDVVQGYADGSYQPDMVVDRGQMAVYIARSVATPTGEAGVPEVPAGAVLTFPDMTADNDWGWCLKHVEYIAGLGIVGGYDDGAYHPEREVTRDQMAVYIQRAFDLPMYPQ